MNARGGTTEKKLLQRRTNGFAIPTGFHIPGEMKIMHVMDLGRKGGHRSSFITRLEADRKETSNARCRGEHNSGIRNIKMLGMNKIRMQVARSLGKAAPECPYIVRLDSTTVRPQVALKVEKFPS
jgi:hypothetical protein